MEDWATVLVVAKRGRLRDSLNAILAAMPEIGIIKAVDDGLSALGAFTASPPTLMVLDTDLSGNGALLTLKQVKARWPHTRSIVLADDVEQQQMTKAAGADAALLKGFTAGKFFTTVERLLAPVT